MSAQLGTSLDLHIVCSQVWNEAGQTNLSLSPHWWYYQTREIGMKELLKHFSIIVERPILWGEMDAFQHVNNTVYFRFFEDARIVYFEKLNVMKIKELTGVGPILASTHCKFRLPLTYPDTVSIGTRISRLEEDRFTMDYLVVSHRCQKVAAEGEGILVAFNYKVGKKDVLPPDLKRQIAEIEESAKS